MLGPDEVFPGSIEQAVHDFEQRTRDHWTEWVRTLSIPFEWQSAVIRAAITLQLCFFEETGAIVAALTTSIPEAPGSERNWDYRYCWLRDAYFVIHALNRLGATRTMESYLGYLSNLVAGADGALQPVYGIGREAALVERIETDLPGYRGMGPVRVGNQAHEHIQNDVYGSAVLAATQTFFDERLLHSRRRAPVQPARGARSACRGSLGRARRRAVGAAQPGRRPHLLERDVLGRLRPPGPDRRAPRPG